MMLSFVPAEEWHVKPIADNLRDADAHEVWASSRLYPYDAMKISFTVSELTWTGLLDGKPVMMFGAGGYSLMEPLKGSPWLLGTNDIIRVKTAVLRNTKKYVGLMRDRFPILENFVHAENKVSIQWLKWSGFEIEDPRPLGPDKELFHRFTLREEDDNV